MHALKTDPHETLIAFDAFNTLVTYDSAPFGGALQQLLTAAHIQIAADRYKWHRYALTHRDTIQNIRIHLANNPTCIRISNSQRSEIENAALAELRSVRFCHNEVPDVLREIARTYPITIISNIGQGFGEAVSNLLYKHKLHNIINPQKASFSYDVGALKGDRKIFEHAVHAHKKELTNLLMIGNHLAKDILSVRALGGQAIQIVRDGTTERQDKDGHIIRSLSELHTLLATSRGV